MATPTLDDLVTEIRAWTNRDDDIVPDSRILAAMRYAADTAYKELEIPPLEYTTQYTVTADDETDKCIPVPSDLSNKFIHIAKLDDDDQVEYFYDTKLNTRSFRGMDQPRNYGNNSWTRQGSSLLLYPAVEEDDKIEIYYYRRLAALDALYEVTVANYSLGILTNDLETAEVGTGVDLYFPSGTTDASAEANFSSLTPTLASTTANPDAIEFLGTEAANWLKDENEKILLFGALLYLFQYLDEPESVQRFMAMFTSEIESVNMEDKKRETSGGTVRRSFPRNRLL